jgi:hypothetical protein
VTFELVLMEVPGAGTWLVTVPGGVLRLALATLMTTGVTPTA